MRILPFASLFILVACSPIAPLPIDVGADAPSAVDAPPSAVDAPPNPVDAPPSAVDAPPSAVDAPGARCGDGVTDPGEVCDGDCPSRCDDSVACTMDQLVGSASSCSATCSFAPITACVSGDGCCAPGCTSVTDGDCSAACGNGVTEAGEVCDGDCPSSCSDSVACTTDRLVGSASSCSATCSFAPITACLSGDGCCAPGCTSSTDSDCPFRRVPIAGDFVVDERQELALVDLDAATPTPISPFAGGWPSNADLSPVDQLRASPDGRYVAFVADATTDGANDLYVVDVTVAAPRAVVLTSHVVGRSVLALSWSPDGRWLAYSADSEVSGRYELFVVDLIRGPSSATPVRAHATPVSGGDVQPATALGGRAPNVFWAWSTDSTRLYFVGDIATNGAQEAFARDLRAGTTAPLVTLPVGRSVSSLTAVGEDLVVFTADLDTPFADDVYAIDASGRPAVRLNPLPARDGLEVAVDLTRGESIRVSFDQTRVLFLADLAIDGVDSAYYVDLSAGVPSTSGTAVLAHPPLSMAPQRITFVTWSPTENRYLVWGDFFGDTRAEVFIGDARSSAPAYRALLSPPPPAYAQVTSYDWSPNGETVVVSVDYEVDDRYDLYFVDVRGAAPSEPVRVATPRPGQFMYLSRWISPTAIAYHGGPSTLYDVMSVDVSGVATRLNGPLAISPGAGFRATRRVGDGRLIIGYGNYRRDDAWEIALIDPSHPGRHTPLHPPLPSGGALVWPLYGR